MVGILVHGNNHFILSGPPPDDVAALALVRQFSIVRIGETPASTFEAWRIGNKEFRENLEWAVVVPDICKTSAPVAHLLAELTARGIKVRHYELPAVSRTTP